MERFKINHYLKNLETIISLEDSAKLISSQSNKLKQPIEGNTKTIA